ncbi:MAG: hypothetical protein V1728_02870 [Candidatus Micrarchaeota archaeon]
MLLFEMLSRGPKNQQPDETALISPMVEPEIKTLPMSAKNASNDFKTEPSVKGADHVKPANLEKIRELMSQYIGIRTELLAYSLELDKQVANNQISGSVSRKPSDTRKYAVGEYSVENLKKTIEQVKLDLPPDLTASDLGQLDQFLANPAAEAQLTNPATRQIFTIELRRDAQGKDCFTLRQWDYRSAQDVAEQKYNALAKKSGIARVEKELKAGLVKLEKENPGAISSVVSQLGLACTDEQFLGSIGTGELHWALMLKNSEKKLMGSINHGAQWEEIKSRREALFAFLGHAQKYHPFVLQMSGMDADEIRWKYEGGNAAEIRSRNQATMAGVSVYSDGAGGDAPVQSAPDLTKSERDKKIGEIYVAQTFALKYKPYTLMGLQMAAGLGTELVFDPLPSELTSEQYANDKKRGQELKLEDIPANMAQNAQAYYQSIISAAQVMASQTTNSDIKEYLNGIQEQAQKALDETKTLVEDNKNAKLDYAGLQMASAEILCKFEWFSNQPGIKKIQSENYWDELYAMAGDRTWAQTLVWMKEHAQTGMVLTATGASLINPLAGRLMFAAMGMDGVAKGFQNQSSEEILFGAAMLMGLSSDAFIGMVGRSAITASMGSSIIQKLDAGNLGRTEWETIGRDAILPIGMRIVASKTVKMADKGQMVQDETRTGIKKNRAIHFRKGRSNGFNKKAKLEIRYDFDAAWREKFGGSAHDKESGWGTERVLDRLMSCKNFSSEHIQMVKDIIADSKDAAEVNICLNQLTAIISSSDYTPEFGALVQRLIGTKAGDLFERLSTQVVGQRVLFEDDWSNLTETLLPYMQITSKETHGAIIEQLLPRWEKKFRDPFAAEKGPSGFESLCAELKGFGKLTPKDIEIIGGIIDHSQMNSVRESIRGYAKIALNRSFSPEYGRLVEATVSNFKDEVYAIKDSKGKKTEYEDCARRDALKGIERYVESGRPIGRNLRRMIEDPQGLRQDYAPYDGWWNGAVGNLCSMDALEFERPGAVKFLREKNGIVFFGRYSLKTLLSQHDNYGKRDPSKPVMLVINPLADWNRAFSANSKVIDGLCEGLDVRIVEVGTRYQAARAIIGTTQTYGEPLAALWVGAHGEIKNAMLGKGNDGLIDGASIANGGDLSRFFITNPSVVFVCCRSGTDVKTGMAKTISGRYRNAVFYAPPEPANIEKLAYRGVDQSGRPLFDITWSKVEGTAYLGGQNKSVEMKNLVSSKKAKGQTNNKKTPGENRTASDEKGKLGDLETGVAPTSLAELERNIDTQGKGKPSSSKEGAAAPNMDPKLEKMKVDGLTQNVESAAYWKMVSSANRSALRASEALGPSTQPRLVILDTCFIVDLMATGYNIRETLANIKKGANGGEIIIPKQVLDELEAQSVEMRMHGPDNEYGIAATSLLVPPRALQELREAIYLDRSVEMIGYDISQGKMNELQSILGRYSEKGNVRVGAGDAGIYGIIEDMGQIYKDADYQIIVLSKDSDVWHIIDELRQSKRLEISISF